MVEMSARSAILLIGAAHGLAIALLLAFRKPNRTANLLLAGMLVTLTMELTPQILGFAGFYDTYPWLSFAPFNVTYSYGPLIYLYTARLILGRTPRRWLWHLAPAFAQFAYYSFWFLQSLETKLWFVDAYHEPYVVPAETLITLTVAMAYLIAAFRLFRRYQRWLPQAVADRENFRMPWLRNYLIAASVGYLVGLGFELVDTLIQPLSYRQEFPMYVVLALMVYYVGIEGYRHAGLAYPAMPADRDGLDANGPATPNATAAPQSGADHETAALEAFGQLAKQRLIEEAWHLNPSLTLADMAKALGSNTAKLSRAINLGLGENFNALINRCRVEAVKAQLQDPSNDKDMLQIALDCGFNSKTNFNRNFKRFTGQTPLSYRREVLSKGATS